MKKTIGCILLSLFFSLGVPLFAEELESVSTPSPVGRGQNDVAAGTACAVFAGIFSISGALVLAGSLVAVIPMGCLSSLDVASVNMDTLGAVAIGASISTLVGLIFMIPAVILLNRSGGISSAIVANQELNAFRGALTSENIPEWSVAAVNTDSEQSFSFQF